MARSDTLPLHALSLRAAGARIASGEVSAVDYANALVARIAAVDRDIDAWAHFDASLLRQRAEAADRLRAAGERLPLAGLPVGVKDILATADQPTQMGSPVFEGNRPGHDAYCVARLRAAGALIAGKTVTTEVAYMQPSKTRNPWNPSHTPGGSSSGSAAAVASGQVPGAIGTQTNGSVIRPAAFCGVVGFKPSLGSIPFAGGLHFSPTLDQIGVITRSVDDAALLAAAITTSPMVAPDLVSPPRRPRLAVVFDLPWVTVECDEDDVVEHCATLLRREADVDTPALPQPCRHAKDAHRTIMLYEAASELAALQARARERLSARLDADLDAGRRIPAGEYQEALARRRDIVAALHAWMRDYDAVLMPSAPGGAPASLETTGDPSCCTLWSLAGYPAITIPVARDGGGMPLGLQLAARHGDDDALLAVASWCESRLPFAGLVGGAAGAAR